MQNRLRLLWMILLCASAFCVFLFHDHYWQYRGMFDGQGRYFDPSREVVFQTQSGMVWGGLAAFFLLAAGVLIIFKGDRQK